MANETKVQAFIHALEEGGWVSRIRLVLLIAAIAMVYFIVIFSQFKGLSNNKGMDQAQIGRHLASGHGFTTKFLRPLANCRPIWAWSMPFSLLRPLNWLRMTVTYTVAMAASRRMNRIRPAQPPSSRA